MGQEWIMIDFGWPVITIGLGGGIHFMSMGCYQIP